MHPEHLKSWSVNTGLSRFPPSNTYATAGRRQADLIWRSGVPLREKAQLNGNISLRLESDLQGRRIVYSARIRGDAHRWDNLRLEHPARAQTCVHRCDNQARLDDACSSPTRAVTSDVQLAYRLRQS